ncbi:MAG: GSCFA domain-containing protein [Bacteroidales bacterium]|nr:GSCFA domain-containing protein [Bacteroidales bacterium]
MELRTTFKIEPSGEKITYNDPVMFIGSCFATSIGRQFEIGHMPVMINPSGTVYNPVSVCNTLNTIINGLKYRRDDLYNHEGTWVSFDHYTDFSSTDPLKVLAKINRNSDEARGFLDEARFLFITFGTARIFRWKQSGKIVSNCHKIPAANFSHELLTVDAIVTLWNKYLDKLLALYPQMKVVFTISPVRHWKDGAHGNHVSKSVLFLAVEELLKHPSRPDYFPAYELVMDDLRDYRFYDEDMLQPSASAIEYIWRAFTGCYFSKPTLELWNEVNKITKAFSHRIREGSGEGIRKFAERSLLQIESVKKRIPSIDLEKETEYFRSLQQLNHL